MPEHQPRRALILAGLALSLAACGSNDAELKQYASEKKMSETQTAAFMACANDLRRNKPMFPVKDGNRKMISVPMEVCACQGQTIASVFTKDGYKSHATFAEYMAKDVKKRPPRFAKKVLKDGIKSPDAAKRLEASLKSCVQSYENKNKEQSAALFELVPLPVAEPKDEKTASAS